MGFGRFPFMLWARSSAGRALRSQCRGQEFDPLRVHHKKAVTVMVIAFFVVWYLQNIFIAILLIVFSLSEFGV